MSDVIESLYDHTNREVTPHQCFFYTPKDREEFLELYNKRNKDGMITLCELWDTYPSDYWSKDFIQEMSEVHPNEYERYMSGEILYIQTKKNMAISGNFVELINDTLPKDSTILEFGSGRGTQKLAETFNMLSIEEDSDWIGRYDSEYVHAEIKDDWYDIDKVNEFLKNKTYNAILIDGPAKGNRNKVVELISSGKLEIDSDVYIFIDDTEREDGQNLLEQMKDLLNREHSVMEGEEYSFSYIEPKENKK